MIRDLAGLVLCCATLSSATAGVDEAIAAMNRGDYEVAYEEFSLLADQGDDRAMITIGLWFAQGQGFPRDDERAMEWYLRAFELGNGDAYNNIGVLYRDGLGVERNRSIAYSLFLLTHLRGLGSDSTQIRANRNLRREISETSDAERALALCQTEVYLEAFVRSRGRLESPADEHLPAPGRPRIKDDPVLWLESERAGMDFDCPPPWDALANH